VRWPQGNFQAGRRRFDSGRPLHPDGRFQEPGATVLVVFQGCPPQRQLRTRRATWRQRPN